MLSAKRDARAAERFFRKILKPPSRSSPRVINVDRSNAYPPAVEELKKEGVLSVGSQLRQRKYLNNLIEQDHRFIKRRVNPGLGFSRLPHRLESGSDLLCLYPLSLLSDVRAEVRKLDRDLPVSNIQTIDQTLRVALGPERFAVFLLVIFATVALSLAAVGLYGVMSYAVSQRTREIGIRMALGARRSDVMMMVIGQGIKLAGAGILLGLGGALALTRLMETLVFGVSA